MIKSVLDFAWWPSLVRRRQFLDSLTDGPTIIRHVCTRGGRRRVFANQHPDEIGPLFDLVRAKQPNVIVEIGTSCGGTFYLWSRAVRSGGIVVSIDKPGEPGSVRPAMRSVYRTFGRQFGVTAITIDGDSHAPETFEKVRQVLAGRQIDFLFIDGDHSYNGVKADFESYQKLVAATGLIAMHDVSFVPGHPSIEVPKFWSELANEKSERTEFVATRGTTPGIGVICKAA